MGCELQSVVFLFQLDSCCHMLLSLLFSSGLGRNLGTLKCNICFSVVLCSVEQVLLYAIPCIVLTFEWPW